MRKSKDNVLTLLQEHKAELSGLCERSTFVPGSVLFREGEEGDSAFVIEKGEIVVSRVIDGREKAIGVAGAGDIVGEIALFSGNPRTATAVTNKELKAIVLTRDGINRMKTKSPQTAIALYERILQIVTGRLRGAIDHYEVIYHLLT
ncbi:MAG: cyclic nucleotide-binding domain-containing protein [Candidatus Hydrogenedentota bacterium]